MQPVTGGRLEVFAMTASTGGIGHTWQTAVNNGWSPWEDLTPSVLPGTDAAVFQNADGRLELFFVARASNHLSHMSQSAPNSSTANPNNTGWSEVEEFPFEAFAPAVFQNADGSLDVFAGDELSAARAAFAAEMSQEFCGPGDALAAQLDSATRRQLERGNARDIALYDWIVSKLEQ